MTARCPHCRAAHDVSHRSSGDRVWCHCDGWFLVRFVGADVLALACDAPVSWPKRKNVRS